MLSGAWRYAVYFARLRYAAARRRDDAREAAVALLLMVTADHEMNEETERAPCRKAAAAADAAYYGHAIRYMLAATMRALISHAVCAIAIRHACYARVMLR